MNEDEYLKLAEVEDRMWYFRSLHAHVRRELAARLTPGDTPPGAERRGLPDGGADLPARPAILDAGCGTGGLILRLRAAQPRWRFSGIDFMPMACDLARRRCGPETDIRVASITALPFVDASFDAVVSADVVCQVDDPAAAGAEFFRVLRPGGIVVINVPAYMWMWSYHDDSCQTRHRYTRSEIDAWLRQAGFEQRWTSHWNALPFPLIWAKRKLFRTAADTSDVKDYPAAVDAVLGAAMALEQAWLRVGGRWAWGTSVFAVARKP